MEQEKEESSVFKALGIDEEWEILNDHRLGKEYASLDTISDTLLAMAQRIKKEEFGEPVEEISSYERKLMLSSLSLAQMIISHRSRDGIHAMMSQIVQLGKEGDKSSDQD